MQSSYAVLTPQLPTSYVDRTWVRAFRAQGEEGMKGQECTRDPVTASLFSPCTTNRPTTCLGSLSLFLAQHGLNVTDTRGKCNLKSFVGVANTAGGIERDLGDDSGNGCFLQEPLHLVTLEGILGSAAGSCSGRIGCSRLHRFVRHHACSKLLLGLLKAGTCCPVQSVHLFKHS